MKNRSKGFTLIELLVVIAIIGILSTLSVVALNSARARARDAKRISDIRQLQTALEMYYSASGSYPPDVAGPTGAYVGGFQNLVDAGLLNAIPVNPKPADNTTECGSWRDYFYHGIGDSTAQASYTISYCLGSGTGGLKEGKQIASPLGIGNNFE